MESTANILKTIEERISQLPLQREPQGLYEPILYSMGNGGKRIRPLLTVLACQMFDMYCGNILHVLKLQLRKGKHREDLHIFLRDRC